MYTIMNTIWHSYILACNCSKCKQLSVFVFINHHFNDMDPFSTLILSILHGNNTFHILRFYLSLHEQMWVSELVIAQKQQTHNTIMDRREIHVDVLFVTDISLIMIFNDNHHQWPSPTFEGHICMSWMCFSPIMF